MTQPSGRVCSFRTKYRSYLRSSPLSCLTDSLSILIHLIIYLTTFPFQDGIHLLIQQRFGKEEDEGADESREEGTPWSAFRVGCCRYPQWLSRAFPFTSRVLPVISGPYFGLELWRKFFGIGAHNPAHGDIPAPLLWALAQNDTLTSVRLFGSF